MTEGTVSISGSRNIMSRELVYYLLKFIIKQYRIKPTKVKLGGADGVDKRAEDFFRTFYPHIEVEVIKPDYGAYPANMKWKAPLDRNLTIVEDTVCLIAIWEGVEYGRKGGTRDARDKALAVGVPVFFVNVAAGTIEYLSAPEVTPADKIINLLKSEQVCF